MLRPVRFGSARGGVATMTGMAQARGLRERKKEQTRAVIARTAIRMFLERGFDHVSIAEIAAAAGVSKMTVTNYFPTKEDLVISAHGSLIPDLAGGGARTRTG